MNNKFFRTSRNDRGIALVITLLLLSLTTALGLVMYLSVSSDLFINGYYRNFRGGFYAADSGLNIARAQLTNQVVLQVPSTFATPPLADPNLVAATATTFLTTQYTNYTSLKTGQAAASWPESFKVSNVTFTLATGSPTVTSRDASNNPTGYSYVYNYTLSAAGQSQATQQATVSEKGSMTFNITGAVNTTEVSFAAFGAFIDNYPPCQGPLVPGTMTGPMFTNGAWQFTTGSYIFTDTVGQANTKADYWFGSSCYQSTASSYKVGSQTIKPSFQGGFNLGQAALALPDNDFSQKRAVLDGLGTNTTNPTNAELNAALMKADGSAYPSGGTTSGVFVNYGTVAGANVMHGGGIYVEGAAQVTLSPSGSSAQVYTIVNNSTTTTVTTDPLATPPVAWNCPVGTTGTTVLQSGASTKNICSVPMNNITSKPATLLYVNGAITSLKGPGPGQAAVQDGSQILVNAKNDITATGDILYKTEPVTTTQNQIVPGTSPACCNGSPVATLIPGNDKDQVLGIFTTNGNFNLKSSANGSNIQIDASIATIRNGGSGGITTTGAYGFNTVNIVGGRIQNNIMSANVQARNVYFDRRFTNRPGFAPPWFPSTTVTQGGALATNITSSVQRVQWLNQTIVQ
ncbi:MAG TPA: hypothetical protein VE422_02450 [Terriglobia bacterium]|nr:hypothetical protein [Terriglobia bacterium]